MTNAWRIVAPQLLGATPIGNVDTAENPAHPAGTIAQAYHQTYGSGEFIYLKGVASTAVGSAVMYSLDDMTTTLTVADIKGPIAIATAAVTASTSYGWYQISGKAVVKAGTVADNALVYVTASGGILDDAVVAGDRIKNALFASADGTPSAGLAEIEIARPFSDDGSSA